MEIGAALWAHEVWEEL